MWLCAQESAGTWWAQSGGRVQKRLKELEEQVQVAQLCLTLCNHLDCAVHGILQARILEWVAFPFSRRSSQSRDQTQVSHIAGRFFTSWATREALEERGSLASGKHACKVWDLLRTCRNQAWVERQRWCTAVGWERQDVVGKLRLGAVEWLAKETVNFFLLVLVSEQSPTSCCTVTP